VSPGRPICAVVFSVGDEIAQLGRLKRGLITDGRSIDCVPSWFRNTVAIVLPQVRLGFMEVKSMRPTALILILSVLIAALWAFDAYEYDGQYSAAAWDHAKKMEHDLESWVGKSDR